MIQASTTCSPRRRGASASRWRLLSAAGLVILAGSFAGCSPPPEPEAPPPPPTPEERFEQIVNALEEKLNDSAFGSAGAAAEYGAPLGTPITDAKIKVKHTLTPLTAADDVPHAQLCLITEAKVTVTLPPSSKDGDEESGGRKKKADDKDLGDGLPSMESLVVPSRDAAASRLGGSGIHEIDPGVSQRCFDLEYRDGKWVLVSEVDEDDEPFNALAIEYALKKQ